MNDDTITFTGRQIAAARELVGIDQKQLAIAAGISAPTLRRMELSTGIPSGLKNNLLAVQRAIEEAGVVFVKEGADGGAGVRLIKTLSSAPTIPLDGLNSSNDW